MKPYDIYNLWVLFDKATSDPAFSPEQKIALGTDMLAALPPEMLCSSSKPSLTVVREAMEGRLNVLNTSVRSGETGLRARASAVASSDGEDQSAVAGDGLSLEGLGTSHKTSRKAKAKGQV